MNRKRYPRAAPLEGTLKLTPLFYGLAAALFVIIVIMLFLPDVIRITSVWDTPALGPQPFTVTVDPDNKIIIEDPEIEAALSTPRLSLGAVSLLSESVESIAVAVSRTPVYELLASAGSPSIIVIEPGVRQEQVAYTIGRELGWQRPERVALLKKTAQTLIAEDGAFSPGTYVFAHDASPEDIAEIFKTRFENRILSRYSTSTMEKIPVEQALTIASLIQREAGNEEEMRIISGIIWNRLFAGMKLQIDATLQYARGTVNNGWWPVPRSRDKYLNSPYNTYQHEGLPPTPIANPSTEAVIAALNPKKTSCLFFFHDLEGEFYCSDTYEEHVQKLEEIYGRGR